CNIDVACPAGDAWQDQIRSTVMFTFQSLDPATGIPAGYVCSGSMVNNTAQDNTPYLLTANHCEVDASNSDTVVVYWNYQNSQCRKLNSATNANPGDGSRSQSLVGGSSLIANYAISDFRLLKLVKSIPADYNVFYAGWDHSQLTAPSAVASIHHPNGEEKRISLVTDPSLLTLDVNQVPNMPKVQDSHIRIFWWTAGTTEGGSSGAPLFDQNQRIVGQLSGGSASCANRSQSDWYGRLNLSWAGNTTSPSPSSRLSDWLDPNNTGVAFINGKNANNTPNSTTLENSISQLIAKAESKSSQDFTITIPAGAANLRINTNGVTSDADLYVKFASKPTLILYDERSWSESSNENIFISTPETGTYFIKVYGYTEYSNLTLTASYDVAGSILKTFKNSRDTTIIDTTTTSSTILSNYNNNAGTLKVSVNIKHTDINDISINVIAPNKTKFVIKDTSSKTVSQNFDKSLTFTIPAGIAKGQWTLEVQDTARLDNGYIDYWELSFP
ncbi:MAG: pre-peptidase C-terminal domain-containing protein, partial [Gammaproteobacteria bacterium]